MEQFRNDSEDNESSNDVLEIKVYNINLNISMYVSVSDNESENNDNYILPLKRSKVLRIDSDMENSEGEDEEQLEQLEYSSKNDLW